MKQRTFKQRQRWTTFWFILLLVVSNFTLPSRAQVTIGSNERPVSGAILQLKEKENVLNDTLNSYKGFGLPRVTLSDKYQLYPMFLNNPEDPTSGPNGQYTVNKETLDKTHTGLLVYNLIENEEKELCIGLNQWNGKEWNCFQTKMGNAIADIKDCNTLKFKGQYQNDVALNSSNYLTIDLTVTKAGAYTITAISDPENGYYFTLTGVFLTTGDYTITVPGAGTPINHTEGTPGDLMKITFNGKVLDSCDPLYVQVEDSSKKPLFVMNCALTKVRGVYKIDTPLDPATNYIEMTLNVDLAGIGATYIIETNTVDGIYFKGQGLLSSTTQNIKLIGYGTPNSLNDKKFTITSNSKKTTATCEATVIMVIPKKRMLVLGTAVTYGWVPGTSGVGSYEVLMSDNNFGTKETSYLKTEGYEIIYPGINGSPTPTQVSSIKNYLLTEKVDICYIGQDIYAGGTSASDKEFRSILAEYLNKKGVLILFWEANPYLNGGAQTFFQEFFANPNIKQARVNARGGGLYKLSGINDEITNGPFGDARGKYWGEDASWAMSIGNLPSGEIDVYSWGDDYTDSGDAATHSYVTGFKHKTLNLIFFGDGGFPSSEYSANGNTSSSATICPFYWEAGTMKPIPKPNYGYGSAGQNVYNSIVWCNVMAWAIKQAQFNGINTP